MWPGCLGAEPAPPTRAPRGLSFPLCAGWTGCPAAKCVGRAVFEPELPMTPGDRPPPPRIAAPPALRHSSPCSLPPSPASSLPTPRSLTPQAGSWQPHPRPAIRILSQLPHLRIPCPWKLQPRPRLLGESDEGAEAKVRGAPPYKHLESTPHPRPARACYTIWCSGTRERTGSTTSKRLTAKSSLSIFQNIGCAGRNVRNSVSGLLSPRNDTATHL